MEYSMNNHPRYRKPQKGDADYQLKAWREANNPNIRVLYVRPDLNSDVLPTDGWQRVDSTSLKPVSAAAYFFARMLQDSLQVPVGFISSSWGGTRIEEWIPDGKTPGRRPMYEHLIRPLTGYALRGFLWYQGEANLLDLGETDVYTAKQEHLVDVWRGLWNDADLPFYYVQISPYLYSIRREDIVQKTWIDLPRFWTAQAKAMRQKNTGMVVTTDIPDVLNDIHPPYKWIVGERLCRWALNHTYGFSHVECQGPTLKGVSRDGDKVILEFDHCDGGLVTSDGKQPDWFWANTRNYGSFRKEDATIDGNKVILHIPGSLAHPVIRFGYDETAQPNLRNKTGLPAAPFEYKL
jgi:sialate O-acetylesterase